MLRLRYQGRPLACTCPCGFNFTTCVGAVITVAVLYGLKVCSNQVFFFCVVVPAAIYALVAEKTKRTPLQGKTVLVTGASSGLGKALAIQAAKRGARKVILVSRTAGKLEETAQECTQANQNVICVVMTCDLNDKDDMKRLAAKVTAEHGAIDLLVNNAGAGAWKHIEETTPEDGIAMMAVPVQSAIALTALLVPPMANSKTGHVLNVTSAAGSVGFRGAVGYSTARWAMRGFSKNLYWDLKELNIGVTLLNAAEIEGTNYFVTAGEESHAKIPTLFQIVGKLGLNYSTTSTAWAAMNAVENGWSIANTPSFVTDLTQRVVQIMPFFIEAISNCGSPGWRKDPNAPGATLLEFSV